MLVVLDIGNTQMVLGVYEGERLMHRWRLGTDLKRSADEYWVLLSSLFTQVGITPDECTGLCISSVVPPLEPVFEDLADRYFSCEPLFVKPGVKSGLVLRNENPHELGADRIVNAMATLELYGGPAVAVDFGTATTFDAISANAEYLGGSIVPGIAISAEALAQRAAKLPRVDLHSPTTAIGRNTAACLRSGLILGYASLVDGMVARFREEMDAPDATVVATGGLASLMASHAVSIQHVEPDLTLIGLKLVYERNRGGPRRGGHAQ